MARQGRGRKLNHDIINVTELDDDFDEFTVSNDTSNTVSRDNSRAVSRDSSYNKNKTITNGIFKTTYKDPLSNKNYKDPLQTLSVKDPFKQDSRFPSRNTDLLSDSSVKRDSEAKRTENQKDSKPQNVQQNNVTSTQDSLRQIKTLSSHQVSSTSMSLSKPVTSIHITKRYNATPRVNKNQKGFGHEEKDLYIDDIEDF